MTARSSPSGAGGAARAVALAVAVVLAATACGPPADRSAGPLAGGSTAPPSADPSRGATTRPAPIGTETTPSTEVATPAPTTPSGPPTWAVATTHRTFEDPGRGRTFPTTIHYPAAAPAAAPRAVGDAVTQAAPDAPPAATAFPLVVMVHGYLLPGDGYDRMMRAVAAHGYVVAAPELPHTTGHGGDGLRSDLTNQPADLSVVADRTIELGATGTAIPPISEPTRLAVVGHSDGGLTATAWGYGLDFRDPRVAAVVSLTGGVALFPGAFFPPDSPPLLAVHARDDTTNPYSASVALFHDVPAGRPRVLLTLDAGGHIDPYMFDTGRLDLGDAIAAFLDLTIRGDEAARDRMRAAAAGPGLALEEG